MPSALWSLLVPSVFLCLAFVATLVTETRKQVRWFKRRNALRRWLY